MGLHIEQELDKLKNAIVKIGQLSEHQIIECSNALLATDDVHAKEVRKTEQKIDKLDIKIEEICLNILALQQPVASDLRFIMSAIHISNEMERIGDLAVSVIKKTKHIKAKHDLVMKHQIDLIAHDIVAITAQTNAAFIGLNESDLSLIFHQNTAIKKASEAAIESLIAEMKENSKTVASATNLIIVLKHLERISDHCTNIAESVYFMVHAKIIKHNKFPEQG